MTVKFKTLDSSTLSQTIGGNNWDYQLGRRIGRIVGAIGINVGGGRAARWAGRAIRW